MTKTLTRATLALAALSMLPLVGCNGGGARRIDSQGDDLIVSIDDVDIQDYLEAANDLAGQLLASGELGRLREPSGEPVLIQLDRVANETSDDYVDTALLTDTLRSNLNQSREARFITPGYESALAADDRAEAQFRGEDIQQAGYILSGRISDVRVGAGRTRQSTFVFKLTLTDRRGVGIWERQKFITKQGQRNQVGVG